MAFFGSAIRTTTQAVSQPWSEIGKSERRSPVISNDLIRFTNTCQHNELMDKKIRAFHIHCYLSGYEMPKKLKKYL
jgi:hypothetical protein